MSPASARWIVSGAISTLARGLGVASLGTSSRSVPRSVLRENGLPAGVSKPTVFTAARTGARMAMSSANPAPPAAATSSAHVCRPDGKPALL